MAQELYEKLIELTAGKGVRVEKGAFGEHMQVSSINDGPVIFYLIANENKDHRLKEQREFRIGVER